MFHFDNTCLNPFDISSVFSGGAIICSADFIILPSILFLKNLPLASATLRNTFFGEVFKAFFPVLNNCFSHLLDRFLANVKNLYSLT